MTDYIRQVRAAAINPAEGVPSAWHGIATVHVWLDGKHYEIAHNTAQRLSRELARAVRVRRETRR